MTLVSEPDGGIYDALNKGMARARGDVIGLLHSDDWLATPDVLAMVAQAFDQTSADAVYGDLQYVSAADPDKVLRHWKSGEYSPRLLQRGWMPPHPALFIRRQIYEAYGGYDTSYRIAADYDAILRWFGSGQMQVAYVPHVLVKMRAGGASNRSLANIVRKSREDYRALRSNRVGGLPTLAWKNLRKLGQFRVSAGGAVMSMTDTGIFSEAMTRLDSRSARIGVIGLGYVGLPLAAACARAGFRGRPGSTSIRPRSRH